MRSFPLLLALAACGTASSDTPGETTDSGPTGVTTDTGITTDTGVTTDTGGLTDGSIVQELIAGDRSVDEVVPAVAWSDGWPFFDGTTTWFVH